MVRGKYVKISIIYFVFRLLKCEFVKGICLNICIVNIFNMFFVNVEKILNICIKNVIIMNFNLYGLIIFSF